MLPLLVLVLAIGSGSRTFAREEDAGRLELLLAYPLRRREAVLAKGTAVAAEILIVAAIGFLALLAPDQIFGLDVGSGRLAEAMTGLAVLGLLFGRLALTLGAAVPSKLLAVAVPAGYAAAAYLVSGLHDLAGWLDPLRSSRLSGHAGRPRRRAGDARRRRRARGAARPAGAVALGCLHGATAIR